MRDELFDMWSMLFKNYILFLLVIHYNIASSNEAESSSEVSNRAT